MEVSKRKQNVMKTFRGRESNNEKSLIASFQKNFQPSFVKKNRFIKLNSRSKQIFYVNIFCSFGFGFVRILTIEVFDWELSCQLHLFKCAEVQKTPLPM